MQTGNALHDAANKGVSAAYLSFGMLMLGEYLFPRTNGTVGCPEEGSGSTGGKKGGTSGGTQNPPVNAYQGGSQSVLSSEEAEEIAFNAINGLNKADSVVLGKYDALKDVDGNFILDTNGNSIPTENSYNIIAKNIDAQYFQLDDWEELSSKYSNDEIWKINKKFLDIQTSSGREIYLSNNPADFIGDGSFYSREIQYLIDNGYNFVEEGGLWHAIR